MTHYHAYLLRLWQTGSPDDLTWRASLEDPHKRQVIGFGSLDELLEYLRHLSMEDVSGSRQNGGKTMNTRPYILALWLIPAVLALSLIPLTGARGEGASPPAALVAPAFNPTFYATQDARVDESNPNTNYGSGDLHVGRSSNANRQTLVQFDTAGLPGSAIVTHATMELYAIVNLAAAAEDTADAAKDASRSGSDAAGFAPRPTTSTPTRSTARGAKARSRGPTSRALTARATLRRG